MLPFSPPSSATASCIKSWPPALAICAGPTVVAWSRRSLTKDSMALDPLPFGRPVGKMGLDQAQAALYTRAASGSVYTRAKTAPYLMERS